MGAGAPAAARLGDPVAHSHALAGFLAGAVVGLIAATAATVVIGAGVAALEVATAGLATPLVIGAAAAALEFGAGAYVGGKLMGLAEDEGEKLGSQTMGAPSGQVAKGSPTVFVNGRPAARAGDAETCDAGLVAQGSRIVTINGQPAARVGDKTSCGGQIVQGSTNVFIGGPPVSVTAIQSEVPEWVRWATIVVSILPALGQAARAIGPALAEIEATGFARAAQTGAKALGRAMDERAGSAAARARLGAGTDPGSPTQTATPEVGRRVPDGVPMSQAEFDRIRDLPRGQRPVNPRDYLGDDYVDQHLAKFDGGGSYLTPTSVLDRRGRDLLGRPDGVFIMPKAEMDGLIERTGGDIGRIEQELGIPPGTWNKEGATLSRIDVGDPRSLDLRMPNGRETGANELWMPGGQLPTGGSEAVVDAIPKGSYTETLLGTKP